MQSRSGRLARDFMGRGVVTIRQESSVEEAVAAMDEHNMGSVVVLDALGPCGVFTERDLLCRVLSKGRDPKATTMAEVASPRFPSIGSSQTLEEAAAAMIERKSRLMVFEGADLVGIVTPTDLVRELKGAPEDFSILKVISTKVVTVLPETPVEAVVKLMDDRKIGSVIVVDGDRWAGIFTERDLLRRVLARKRGLGTPVGDSASKPLVAAGPGVLGKEAAGIMADHGFKRLPLMLNDEGIGVVTARDLVEAYVMANRPLAPRVNWVQWN